MRLNQGSLLLEAVITTSIFLVIVLGLFGSFSAMLKASLANINKIQATYLEEEGLEAVRSMRDNGWSTNIASKSSGVPFSLYFTGSGWVSTTSVETIDNLFLREVTLNNVYRDSSQNIVSSGGTLDTNTKLVTVNVSWASAGATTTRTISTYLSNVFNY